MQNTGSGDLQVTLTPLVSLKLDPRNPRLHSKRQIRQIALAIRQFGFAVPILADDDNNVLAGHGRCKAARELGLTNVPVIRLSHLSPAKRAAFKIADNRLSENSTWDARLLGETFRDLQAQDIEFDLDVTGFSAAEIDLLIEGLENDDPASGSPDPVDALDPGLGQSPVTQVGDLWTLGDHRVLCETSLEPDSFDRLLKSQRAQMVFTDPPYNVAIRGNVSGKGAFQHREFAMASGEMTELQFEAFLRSSCRLHAQYSNNGALGFFCMDWRHADTILAAGKSCYSDLKNICVWVKSNPGMGSQWRSQHEFVFVFKNGRAPHRNNVELGRHGRNRSNVWAYPSPQSFGRTGEEGCLAAIHPTVKPVRLVADAILDCTARTDIVLDGFLGSGTTIIAAERTGRHCYGIEIDPIYVDVIVRRWQAYSGETARHSVTGRSFDEIAKERGNGRG
jgi:DNA modification methylase